MSERRTGRHPDAVGVVVRLTEPALEDLHRLHRSNPQVVRWCLKKLLLLERDPEAGAPLLGELTGFRKLTVGDRHWRIVWRVTHDSSGGVIVDVAEVWAAGARSEAAVYEEMTRRVAALGSTPRAIALARALETLGKVAAELSATPEPQAAEPVPAWLVKRLTVQAGRPEAEVRAMAPEDAADAWDEWMRRPHA